MKKKKDMTPSTFLTESQATQLNSIDSDTRNDSKFIRLLLKFLYQSDESVILNRCVKGTQRRTILKDNGNTVEKSAKQEITPQKKEVIRKLFHGRIVDLDISKIDKRRTEVYLNTLINRGIQNILNASKASNKENALVINVDEE